jgi:protein O-mannosyl-transferase
MSQKKQRLKKRLTETIVEKKPEIRLDGIWRTIFKNWKFLLILVLGTMALYFNALNGAFVSDDYATIPNNPQIMNFNHGLSGWMSGLINWATAVAFGIKNPLPYHLISLLFYLGSVVLVFVLTEVLFNDKIISSITSILFAVMPVHVEAVSWISGKPYLLNAFFVLISFILFIYFSKTGDKKYLWQFLISLLFNFAAERVRFLALPFLILIYWISFEHKFKNKINIGKLVLGLLLVVGVVFMLIWPQIIARINMVNSGTNSSGSIFANPFYQYPTSIAKYLQLLLFPVDLTLYHTMFTVPAWFNWLVLAVYGANLVWFWFKDKRYFFVLAFIFAATAPSMAPVKVSWMVAERYMFLGSVGMAMLGGLLIKRAWDKKILAMLLTAVLVLVYAVRVYQRNRNWQTNHDLWVNTCQVSPNSHNAWNNIGDDYDKLNDPENAIKAFAQSYTVKTNYADAYHNQANIFFKIGRLDLARATYEKGLSINPSMSASYIALIQIDVQEKNIIALENDLKRLQALKPNDLQVVYIAAQAYAQVGKKDEAKKLAEMMYKQFPTIPEIKALYDQINSL